MTWTSFLGGLAVGIVATFLLAATEPGQRWFARLGRRVAHDTGVQMHVELDPAVIWAGLPAEWIFLPYYVPNLGVETPPDQPYEWRRWAHDRGGWDLGSSTVRLTLVGASPVTVVLETPVVTASEEPLPAGTKVVRPTGGASIVRRTFNVDLDTFGTASPIISLTRGETGEPIPPTLSWSLQKNEVEEVLIHVTSARPALIHWTARIPVLIDGKRQYIDVHDEGSPISFAGGTVTDCKHWDGSRWMQN